MTSLPSALHNALDSEDNVPELLNIQVKSTPLGAILHVWWRTHETTPGSLRTLLMTSIYHLVLQVLPTDLTLMGALEWVCNVFGRELERKPFTTISAA